MLGTLKITTVSDIGAFSW